MGGLVSESYGPCGAWPDMGLCFYSRARLGLAQDWPTPRVNNPDFYPGYYGPQYHYCERIQKVWFQPSIWRPLIGQLGACTILFRPGKINLGSKYFIYLSTLQLTSTSIQMFVASSNNSKIESLVASCTHVARACLGKGYKREHLFPERWMKSWTFFQLYLWQNKV